MKMPPTPVEVTDVSSRTVRDELHALGGLEAGDIIQVAGDASGVVTSLPFAEGRAVRRGAVLAQLDDREAAAALTQAAAQRDQAKSNLSRAERLADEKVISGQQLEDTRTALRVAEATVSAAAARLDHARIRAPWAGLVGRRKVSPGAYLSAGQPVTELARVDEMKVAFAAPERFLTELRIGTPVSVSVPAYPGRTFLGHITVVDPVVDPDTRTIQLVARLPNPSGVLRPGMSADVSVTLAERANALVVPDEAVFAEGNQSFVYVVKPDSSVTRAAITTGTRDSAAVEIVHGLAAGQRVVRTGQQKLYEGAHVMPVSAAAAMPQ
jgi:membrane fusion protein, multidrug efflux system